MKTTALIDFEMRKCILEIKLWLWRLKLAK